MHIKYLIYEHILKSTILFAIKYLTTYVGKCSSCPIIVLQFCPIKIEQKKQTMNGLSLSWAASPQTLIKWLQTIGNEVLHH